MKVAIAGGGTGGHLFPGIALAQELTQRGNDVFFIGNRGRIEQDKVPAYGFPIEFVAGGQVKGVGFFGALKGLAATFRGICQARRILRTQRPDVVVGVGGYASVAGVTAGWLRRLAVVLCEQNSVPGRANRLLARLARIVFLAFPEAGRYLPKGKVQVVGNPIRIDFRQRFEKARQERRPDRKELFVFGGSQGARRLNEATTKAVRLWMEQDRLPGVVHQTGYLDHAGVREQYAAMAAKIEVREFIDDMPAAYGQADLVLARAGAMSIAEIAACGLPSILVPLPFAADDHQRGNARALVEAGAAVVIENDDLTGEKLVDQVDRLFADPKRLEQMGRAARTLDRPDAAKEICDAITRIAGES